MDLLLKLAIGNFILGLTGGAHCLAMCSPLCGAVCAPEQPLPPPRIPDAAATTVIPLSVQAASAHTWQRTLALHSGRVLSYAVAGAAVALAMGSLAWLTGQSATLKPLWTLMHLVVLAWGGWMLLLGRQPMWLDTAGRSVWQRLQGMRRSSGGCFLVGLLWAFLPCGMLYTALATAAFGGRAMDGALIMVAFALGSMVWLLVAPLLWRGLRQRANAIRQDIGTRLAGAILCAVAVWSLWADAVHHTQLWCM